LRLPPVFNFLVNGQLHKITMHPKRPICTHLSNQIFDSQSSVGRLEPGRVRRIVVRINQKTAGINDDLTFSRGYNFCNIKQDPVAWVAVRFIK
jgi:hypothetical protein